MVYLFVHLSLILRKSFCLVSVIVGFGNSVRVVHLKSPTFCHVQDKRIALAVKSIIIYSGPTPPSVGFYKL